MTETTFRYLEIEFDEFVKANEIEYDKPVEIGKNPLSYIPKRDYPIFYSHMNQQICEKPVDTANNVDGRDVWHKFESNGEGYNHICDVRWCVTMVLQYILKKIKSKNVKIHFTNSSGNNFEYISERHANGFNEIIIAKEQFENIPSITGPIAQPAIRLLPLLGN